MLSRLGLPVSLWQTEINDIYYVLWLLQRETHQESVWLYVPMNEVIRMKEFYSLEDLISDHQHRLQRELPILLAKQILQARPKQIHHHRVVITFNSWPMDGRYSNCQNIKIVSAYLLLWIIYITWFRRKGKETSFLLAPIYQRQSIINICVYQLYSNFLSIFDILTYWTIFIEIFFTFVNFSESTTSDFFNDLKFSFTYSKINHMLYDIV